MSFQPGRQLKSDTETVTVTATALPDEIIYEVVLQADPDNTADIFVGTDTPVIQLVPGESLSLSIDNLNKIFAKSASGSQTLNWLAVLR